MKKNVLKCIRVGFPLSFLCVFALLYLQESKKLDNKNLFCPKIYGFSEPICATDEVLDYLTLNLLYTTSERLEKVRELYSSSSWSFRELQFVTYMHFRGWLDGEIIFSNIDKPISRIMSIGGGVGPTSLFILKKLQSTGQEPMFLMVEKLRRTRQGRVFYMEPMLREFYRVNGISSERISFIYGKEEDERSRIKDYGPFDFVLSLRAWGYHFPIDYYLKEVVESTRPGTILVFDGNNQKNKSKNFLPHIDSLKRHFKASKEIMNNSNKNRTVWLRY